MVRTMLHAMQRVLFRLTGESRYFDRVAPQRRWMDLDRLA